MPSHKFRIGKSVMVKRSIGRNVPGGVYEVIKQLPHNGREYEYRIKSANEEHERVAGEGELTKDELWGKLWQHNLTLLAAKGSERAKAWAEGKPSLPRGRYLVKVHVDADGKLSKDWTAGLGDGDFVGQVEVTSAWPEGYGRMTTVDAGKVGK